MIIFTAASGDRHRYLKEDILNSGGKQWNENGYYTVSEELYGYLKIKFPDEIHFSKLNNSRWP